ncbi:hypothetical protein HNQ59_000380 [Chitinivorax tropicus]|uniref:DUF3617 domain-containing protein n=1 Tax=Chitinivorax tropicus TaxID=714531 RepID=A0A840MEL3_9PROT|nr:DUF3617 family protein [Chitinivorax tropicus]MBB5017118.1 hypothetical protein [Chitinivorax tropicus]
MMNARQLSMAILGLISVMASAQGPQIGMTYPNMKLGLWQVQTEVAGTDRESQGMREQQKKKQGTVKNMSAETKSQIQQAMGRQSAQHESVNGANRVCVRAEQIQSLNQGQVETLPYCSKPEIKTRSDGWSFTMRCNEQGPRTEITGNVVLDGEHAYTSSFNIATQGEDGKMRSMAFQQRARWIAPTCQ